MTSLGAVDQFPERAADTGEALALGQRSRLTPRDDDDIAPGRQAVAVESEGLS
jgi:hypothetical protein